MKQTHSMHKYLFVSPFLTHIKRLFKSLYFEYSFWLFNFEMLCPVLFVFSYLQTGCTFFVFTLLRLCFKKFANNVVHSLHFRHFFFFWFLLTFPKWVVPFWVFIILFFCFYHLLPFFPTFLGIHILSFFSTY